MKFSTTCPTSPITEGRQADLWNTLVKVSADMTNLPIYIALLQYIV